MNIGRQMVSDQRFTRYSGLYQLSKLPSEQVGVFRHEIVARLAVSEADRELYSGGLESFLPESSSNSPLTVSERRTVANPIKRQMAPGLVKQMANDGPSSVPALVEILKHHALAHNASNNTRRASPERSSFMGGHLEMIEAARKGLYRLGPEAKGALPYVEALISEGAFSPYILDGFGGVVWNFTLARMGKSVDQLRKREALITVTSRTSSKVSTGSIQTVTAN